MKPRGRTHNDWERRNKGRKGNLGLDAKAEPGDEERCESHFRHGVDRYEVGHDGLFPEGRLAHQTLGMLLTRRLERMGAKPLGFVASEYAMAVWAMEPMGQVDLAALFAPDLLGDDLEEWLDEAVLMKRHFAHCAQISGLIARRMPGKEKTGRQVTFSTDLIYDVLRSHEPDHILLQAARHDAATGFLDIRRLSDMLVRVQDKIVHKDLEKISPFAVPVMLEVGKEPVHGASVEEAILRDAEADLIADAMQVI